MTKKYFKISNAFGIVALIVFSAYKIGTPGNLYDALRQAASEDFTFARDFPNVNVGAVLDSWVQNPGAPVLRVDVNMETGLITVTQVRFNSIE